MYLNSLLASSCCSSALKSQPLAADGTPALGRAQRVPSPTKAPRGTATKELRALMEGLSLEDGAAEAQGPLGTLPMLSPVRAAGHLRAQLGVDKVRWGSGGAAGLARCGHGLHSGLGLTSGQC